MAKTSTLTKAKTMEQPSVSIKRPPSFRGVMNSVKLVPKKEEATNKIFVDIHTLKGTKTREKKSNIEEIMSNEEQRAKRETPLRSQDLEINQEFIDSKESTLKQSQGPQKNQDIWAEIENLDHQIQA